MLELETAAADVRHRLADQLNPRIGIDGRPRLCYDFTVDSNRTAPDKGLSPGARLCQSRFDHSGVKAHACLLIGHLLTGFERV
jgi:hypothetical protein